MDMGFDSFVFRRKTEQKVVFWPKVTRNRYTITCMVLRDENVLFCMVLYMQE